MDQREFVGLGSRPSAAALIGVSLPDPSTGAEGFFMRGEGSMSQRLVIFSLLVLAGCSAKTEAEAPRERGWRRIAHHQFFHANPALGRDVRGDAATDWFSIDAETWRVRWQAQQLGLFMVGRSFVLQLATEGEQISEPLADARWEIGAPPDQELSGEAVLTGPGRFRLMPQCYSSSADVFVEELLE
jgi:hypothetical protein